MSAEGLPSRSSGHQAPFQDDLVEVIVCSVCCILRRVLDRERVQDQVVSNMADGVALGGARLVLALLGADLKSSLGVVVDHVNDLRLTYPLLPESWGLQHGSHVHEAVLFHFNAKPRRRVSEDLGEGFGE